MKVLLVAIAAASLALTGCEAEETETVESDVVTVPVTDPEVVATPVTEPVIVTE